MTTSPLTRASSSCVLYKIHMQEEIIASIRQYISDENSEAMQKLNSQLYGWRDSCTTLRHFVAWALGEELLSQEEAYKALDLFLLTCEPPSD